MPLRSEIKPPADNPFDVLKEQLIKRTTLSEQRKLQQLFSSEDLGDRKPSQFLRHLQQLLGERASTIDVTFLRELFIQCLPSSVRMVLASTPDAVSLENLTELADKVMEVALPTPTVGAVQSSQLTSELQHLRSEVAHLEGLVKSLLHESPISSLAHPLPPYRSPTPTYRSSDSDTLCWYHQ